MLPFEDASQNSSDADLATARAEAESNVEADRRRPGRPKHISPELVPLLRGEVDPPADSVHVVFGDPDQLGVVRGLALAVPISLALWAGLIFTAYRLLQ